MVNYSYCRENILAKYAPLLDALIDENDQRYDDHMIVMGTEFRAEAYATDEARDARLGPASEHIEYVPTSPEEVAAIEFPLHQMAIGPGLYEPGFDLVAPAVIAAAVEYFDYEPGELDMDVVIARTQYNLRLRNGAVQVSWRALFKPYDPDYDHKGEIDTALWLRGFVAGHLSTAAA